MGDLASHFRARRALLALAPAALAARLLPAQSSSQTPPNDPPEDVRLPNGKKQQDEILKAEYEQNVRDARDLVSLSKSFEEDLEKDDRFVLSLSSLKKLDDMEKLTKRIRGRMKRF
jgi:negative regulator of replication initiation